MSYEIDALTELAASGVDAGIGDTLASRPGTNAPKSRPRPFSGSPLSSGGEKAIKTITAKTGNTLVQTFNRIPPSPGWSLLYLAMTCDWFEREDRTAHLVLRRARTRGVSPRTPTARRTER